MPRQTHRSEEEAKEDIKRKTDIILSAKMRHFLDVEAVRLTGEARKIKPNARRITAQAIIRALVTAYHDKRMIGLVVNPDD